MLAVVLTYNAPTALARCLAAIQRQSRLPERVLVVDNAGTPPATETVAAVEGRAPVEVVRLGSNTGRAGGHAAGLHAFLASGYDQAWVMDDDCIPDPACLERLLARAGALDEPALLFPTWIDQVTGEVANWPAWCGFLLARAIVADVGLPRADFFWWAEDTEYLYWRIPVAGHHVERVDPAEVVHGRVRTADTKPAWKVYYEVRNSVYYRLFIQRRRGRRFYRLTRTLLKTFGRVLREPGRPRKLWLYGRGVVDGLTGRLGPRVPATIAERPPSPQPGGSGSGPAAGISTR